MKRICVIGLGYIGLPTAAMFASNGYSVVGVDLNGTVVNSLNKGEVTITEPGLHELVKKTVEDGFLSGSSVPACADAFIICVPTPITYDKKADMRYVIDAARSILPFLKAGDIVVLESTSPPKTVEGLLCPILAETGLVLGEELYIAHSPERVLPGNILKELVNNDRVIGGINTKSSEMVRDLYKAFVKANIYLTDAATAEICKLMENTYRDINIAFANEIAKISEAVGVNAWEAIALANKHPRVNIHQPGPGVGGHCIAVDPWFIYESASQISNIIKLCRDTNDSMPLYAALRCGEILGGVKGKKIIMLGAAYKPNVDDMRESPITRVVTALEEKGATVVVADPYVNIYREGWNNLYEHAKGASLVVLGVNHREFKNIDFGILKNVMQSLNIFDTRNFLDGEALKILGFNYTLLGAFR